MVRFDPFLVYPFFAMLAHFLAIAVALGSSLFYLAAFFFPEIHRPRDFLWCTVGWFYALVLWICAGRITGGVLLGQTASVALLGWLTWQTLSLRRAKTPVIEQTEISDATIETAKSGFGLGKLVDRFRPDAADPPIPASDSEAASTAPAETSAPAPSESSDSNAPHDSAVTSPDSASSAPRESNEPDPPDPKAKAAEPSESPAPSAATEPLNSEPEAVVPAPESAVSPISTPPEFVRPDDVIVTEPALLNEDMSQVPEPDVVKDLEALGLIEEPDVEPFQVKDEATPPGNDADAVTADPPPSEEPEVIVVKGEVVKDTDPDAWI